MNNKRTTHKHQAVSHTHPNCTTPCMVHTWMRMCRPMAVTMLSRVRGEGTNTTMRNDSSMDCDTPGEGTKEVCVRMHVCA